MRDVLDVTIVRIDAVPYYVNGAVEPKHTGSRNNKRTVRERSNAIGIIKSLERTRDYCPDALCVMTNGTPPRRASRVSTGPRRLRARPNRVLGEKRESRFSKGFRYILRMRDRAVHCCPGWNFGRRRRV